MIYLYQLLFLSLILICGIFFFIYYDIQYFKSNNDNCYCHYCYYYNNYYIIYNNIQSLYIIYIYMFYFIVKLFIY